MRIRPLMLGLLSLAVISMLSVVGLIRYHPAERSIDFMNISPQAPTVQAIPTAQTIPSVQSPPTVQTTPTMQTTPTAQEIPGLVQSRGVLYVRAESYQAQRGLSIVLHSKEFHPLTTVYEWWIDAKNPWRVRRVTTALLEDGPHIVGADGSDGVTG